MIADQAERQPSRVENVGLRVRGRQIQIAKLILKSCSHIVDQDDIVLLPILEKASNLLAQSLHILVKQHLNFKAARLRRAEHIG